MPRKHGLLAVGLAALGALAIGSPPASAIVSPPTVPGACSARTAVPRTTASFVHCRALGRSGSWAQWIDATNIGPAHVVDAQARVRINGRAGAASAPVDLALPAFAVSRWDPVTGRRLVSVPIGSIRTCPPGSRVEPTVRLRDSPTGAWTAWVAAPAFSCPR